MLYLCNAFSLSMLPSSMVSARITVSRLTLDRAREVAVGATQAIGHESTAAMLSELLGMPVGVSRVSVALRSGDSVLVAQYVGPRLPEGATQLPDGARVDFILTTLETYLG